MSNPDGVEPFKWTDRKSQVAIALADGQTQRAVAAAFHLNENTVSRWMQHPDFSAEVDRLTLMMGIASRAERLRIAKRVARQRVRDDDTIDTEKDLLDWLKFAQSETDGIKLDLPGLAAFLDASASLAEGGSRRVDAPADGGGAAGGGAPGGGDGAGEPVP